MKKHNRIQSRKAKLGKTWCASCDRDLVGVGEKCKVCGNREKKANKKPYEGD